ncbi:MAG TPA: hypothetical protein P5084_09905 [Paludibacter sp.]|nr:hypothetical protein [Paludibacter sp.]
MVKKFLYFILITVLISSCKDRNQDLKYIYNANPDYTWGYAQFYGAYYSDYDVNKNVVTLSLFSDSLKIDDEGSLAGHGQYLYLEDVFSAPSDTILPEGTYKVDTIRNPFTIAKGEELDIDGNNYSVGAFIYYIEKNAAFSVMKYIVRGNLTLSYSGTKTSVVCDFVLSDSTILKGEFKTRTLPYIDESVSYPAGMARKKLKLKNPVYPN